MTKLGKLVLLQGYLGTVIACATGLVVRAE